MTQDELKHFLSLLSHDLQNQLGAVDLNLQIMPTLFAADDPAVQALLPFISRAATASQDLVETFSDLQVFACSVSKLSEENVERPGICRPVSGLDLSSIVRDCALALAASAKTRGIVLETFQIDEIITLGDAEYVGRSIKILVKEALRASFPGATVQLKVAHFANGPGAEISTTQEGVFEENRPLLSVAMARGLLKSSRAELVFKATREQSAVQIQFQPDTTGLVG